MLYSYMFKTFVFLLSEHASYFFNHALRYGWMVNATLLPLYTRERPGSHCIGGWEIPKVGLDEC
jgi:hypothetical protein